MQNEKNKLLKEKEEKERKMNELYIENQVKDKLLEEEKIRSENDKKRIAELEDKYQRLMEDQRVNNYSKVEKALEDLSMQQK